MNTVMKKVRQARLELILLAIANVVLGVALIAKPDDAVEVVCRVIGIVLAVWGVIRIINYFRVAVVEAFGSFGLVQGVALIAFGVYIAVAPYVMAEIFTVMTAILIIIGGVIKIQYSVDLKRMHSNTWWIELVAAIMLVVLGAIALVNPFAANSALMVFVGISLVVDGVFDLASIIRISIIAKHIGKNVKNAMQNADKEVIEGEIVVKND